MSLKKNLALLVEKNNSVLCGILFSGAIQIFWLKNESQPDFRLQTTKYVSILIGPAIKYRECGTIIYKMAFSDWIKILTKI